MAKENSVAIIIPAYNEREGLPPVLDKLLQVRGTNGWDIIVVDDGSTDGMQEALAGYAGRVRVIRHPSNRGYGASLKTGIQAARTENVLFFDADGQHDASDIPPFVEALKQYECVFSVRPKGAGIPAIRKPGKWILQKVCNFLADQKIPDINSGFRAGRRQLFLKLVSMSLFRDWVMS